MLVEFMGPFAYRLLLIGLASRPIRFRHKIGRKLLLATTTTILITRSCYLLITILAETTKSKSRQPPDLQDLGQRA